jgi:hypothetical protein
LALAIARTATAIQRNMLAPQFRGYRPLRIGGSQVILNRPNTLLVFGVVTFLLGCWHFFGGQSGQGMAPLGAHAPLPKYWSVSGKGSLEGVTDFKKPENLSIVALVFYGRPPTVSILDCYLKVRGARR